MEVLKSIGKSLSDSLKISQSLQTSMVKIEYAITSIAYASEASAKNLSAITKDLTGSAAEFHSRMDKASESTNKFTKNMQETDEGLKEFRKEVKDTQVSFSRVLDLVSDKLVILGQKANEFSEASNRMIKISGMSGDTVRDFRSEIVSIVNQLNLDTGSAYSPIQAYDLLISTSQGVTSNLEAIEEMARPLLLSYESIDVNINSVATLFNRFYTRYTFSSKHMEDTLDNIRGNTAGNAADAEVTMRNIDALKVIIDNAAGDNNDLREQLLESVSNYTSWIESLDMDSAKFTEFIKSAAYGDFRDKGLNTLINYSGMSQYDIGTLARSGDVEGVTKALMTGVYNMMSQFESDGKKGLSFEELGPMSQTLEALGHDVEFLLDSYNAMISKPYQSLEDFKLQQIVSEDMESLVGDKFYTMQEKSSNWLENIYKKIADIQEYLPFGLSDIMLAILAIKGLGFGGPTSAIRGVGSFLGGAKNYIAGNAASGILNTGVIASRFSPAIGGAMTGASGVLGNIAALGGGLGGAAMLAGGGLAGAGLAIDGISGAIDSDNSTGYRVASGLQAGLGVGGTAALIGLGMTNPIGWVALAAGGLTLLGKNAVENATALSGNAEVVESHLDAISKSLEEENTKRLSTLSTLSYQFDTEKDLEKKREILRQSGLFTEEDLQNQSESQLKALINSYKDAASAMTDVTDGVMKLADKYYTEKESEQQKGFIDDLKSANLSEEEMTNVIRLLQASVSDGDLLKKFDKALKDGSISKSEFNDLLYGGKNSWFDKTSLTDKGLEVAGMRQVAGYLGWDKEYTTSQNAAEVTRLYNALYTAPTPAAKKKAWQDIVDSGLEAEIREVYGSVLDDIKGYATGTNYITRDQLALVHEGEAITPKKYNPAANMNELETLREQNRQSQKEMREEIKMSQMYMKQTFETLSEIRDFLSYWRDDNIKRESAKESRNRFSSASRFLSNYTLETT